MDFREIPMMPLFSSPQTYGTHFKMDCCQIWRKLLVKSAYPPYSWGLSISPTNVAGETLHQCPLEPKAEVLQLPSQQSTHGDRGGIWAAKGKVENAS